MANLDIIVVNESKIDASFPNNNLPLKVIIYHIDVIEMLLGVG